jgi:bla regulator protein BlaR1
MPALFVFLLKVNIALLLFCAGYYLVLRHLTFYTLNRIYLVAAILFATIYPQINLDNFAQRHQQLAKPVQVIVLNFEAPAQTFVQPLVQPAYWQWITVAFWIGAIVLALRLLMQLFSLYRLHRVSVPMRIRDHKVRVIHGDTAPFSFWQSIYINPANHNPTDLKSILKHEQIHVNDWHTLDVLLAEISAIFYWFNPGVWLMKKAVRENIEFITDRKIVNNGTDTKQYQYSLVNVSFSSSSQNIVNHFNLSTIKKRIIMMNAKRSSKLNLTRYALLVPAVLLCLLIFSFSKAELVKKTNALTSSAAKIDIIKIADAKISSLSASVINYITRAKDTAKLRDTNKMKGQYHGTFYYSIDDKNGDPVYSFHTFADTDKKHHDTTGIKHFNISYSLSTDTNPKILLKKLNGESNVIFVVDGKVVNGLSQISQDNIGSVSVEKSGPDGKGVVYISTKNNYKPITSVHINGTMAKTMLDRRNEKMINGSMAIIDTVKEGGKIKLVNGRPLIDTVFVGNNFKLFPDVNRTFGYLTVVGLSKKDSNSRKVLLSRMKGFNTSKDGDVVVTGYDNYKEVLVNKIRGYSVSKDGKVTRDSLAHLHFPQIISADNINIDHLSDKLIIIDGKKVTTKEFKKLSAGDIESMNVRSGDAVTKQYGDKAKDGVLLITTKKK